MYIHKMYMYKMYFNVFGVYHKFLWYRISKETAGSVKHRLHVRLIIYNLFKYEKILNKVCKKTNSNTGASRLNL